MKMRLNWKTNTAPSLPSLQRRTNQGRQDNVPKEAGNRDRREGGKGDRRGGGGGVGGGGGRCRGMEREVWGGGGGALHQKDLRRS